MPAPIPQQVKLRALTLLAQSTKPTLRQKCIEVQQKLEEEGYLVHHKTIRTWATPQPLSIGPQNSRANRSESRNVTNDEENINAVNQALEENGGQVSIRQLSSIVSIGKTSVHKILKSQQLNPYKCIEVQALSDSAKAARVQFCNLMIAKMAEDVDYHRQIIFTDETSVGEPKLNHQNDRVWSDSQPAEFREHRRIRKKAMAWSGMNYFLGVLPTYWVDNTLNSERYREMLHTRIIPDLSEGTSPDELANFYIFMQDGSPAHTTSENIDYLSSRFSCVISKNAEIAWPPYSPDLNPCDYYLWSKAKQQY